jgi:peroxisomal membrane protein 4
LVSGKRIFTGIMVQLSGILTVQDLLYILRGVRNGIYYGGKVRAMHSVVMATLFMKGTLWERFTKCGKLTGEHALRLGVYIGLYKTTIAVLKNLNNGQRHRAHFFIAGLLNGYLVYRSKDSNINQQIILYLLSRVLTGGAQSLQTSGHLPSGKWFPLLAALCWGLVMFLFENDPKSLQPSLTGSMEFLYHESEQYNNWTDFVPVYIPAGLKTSIESVFSR